MRAHYLNILAFGLLAAFIAGCASTAPRFGTKESSTSTKPTERKTGPRFASKESEEEVRETDKHVDAAEVERIKTGARDFKREKNPAIKPLDQSKMMREISKWMGTPYKLGGNDQEGIDCSAYTQTVFRHAIGVPLPRSSHEQSALGNEVAFDNLKFGDLVFFNTTGASASHVGIYLGDDLFAHASVTFGVTISSLQSSYYKNRFEKAKRIVE
ncbi:MAG: C40 family peptidase [Ignavibacteriales bacterium]|nr:C40 family peptidase [Ignavibacteriales bacterium]